MRTVTDVVPNRFWTATEVNRGDPARLAASRSRRSTGTSTRRQKVDDLEAWRLILILDRAAPGRKAALNASGPGTAIVPGPP